MNKKILIYTAKISLGAGIYLYLLFNKKINFDFFRAEYLFLLSLLFGLQLIMFAIGVLRWHLIGKKAYQLRISLGATAYISWVSQFFSAFLPATVGTDLSRIFYIGNKTKGSKAELFKVTLADRLNGAGGMLICSFLGAIFYFLQIKLYWVIFITLLVLAGLGFFPKNKLKSFLLKRGIQLSPYSALILSLVNFLLKALSVFLIVAFLSGNSSLTDFYLCMGSQFIEGLAILPANIGIGHILFDKALSFIQVINGAQVYNIYFTVKILFKLTGFAGWLFIKKDR